LDFPLDLGFDHLIDPNNDLQQVSDDSLSTPNVSPETHWIDDMSSMTALMGAESTEPLFSHGVFPKINLHGISHASIHSTASTPPSMFPAFSTSAATPNATSPASTHSSGTTGTKRKASALAPTSHHQGMAANVTAAGLSAGNSGGDEEAEDVVLKRQRNTLAARKYRQKRLDRISDLEKALSDMTGERDDLKLQLARREAEVEALREMLAKK
jgi:hypothetical protein